MEVGQNEFLALAKRGTHSNRYQVEGVNAKSLERDLRRAVSGEVRFDGSTRSIYSTDASNYRQIPIGVVVPRTQEDVAATFKVAHQHRAPIVLRGGGTSLAGQACNVGIVIDCSKYLRDILWIDAEKRQARVQGGTVLDDLNDRAKREHNLVYGPDPSTHEYCTIGGMIGNNACGVHSVMAGRTEDNVVEMEVLTYDGLRMRVGETTDPELEQIIAEGGRRGEIYAGLKHLRDMYAPVIRKRYPNIPRRVSGYNLEALLPENGFNVAKALVGSEGTLVYVLEATVRLVYSPPVRATVILGYPDIYDAADDVVRVRKELDPLAIEGMDQRLVTFVKRKQMKHANEVGLLPGGRGWLICEFGGKTKEKAHELAAAKAKEIEDWGNGPTVKHFEDEEEAEAIWAIRESGLGATAWVHGMKDTWPGWEDVAIDPPQLGDYLRDYRVVLDKYGYDCAFYGHFGDGCVHCRVDFGLHTHSAVMKYMDFLNEASDLVVKYNGSFSAEHGDGQARGILLPKMYGPQIMEAFRNMKRLFDPDWKMNPGKVIQPFKPSENLRLGTDYNPDGIETYYHYPEDEGSFHRAALRCVGIGKCRRTDDAFMCPSYLVTKEEKHTTRGRARALFEMVRGDFDDQGWRSEAVKDALDLCLSCKGCKTECPVSVDIATYKSEFLAHYYKGRLRPVHFYAMGLIGVWAEVAKHMPGAANFFSQNQPFSGIMKRLGGIHPDRSIPPFAEETFTHWFFRRPGRKRGRPVILWPDPFNNFFFPGHLKAAVEVLERTGFRAIVPKKRIPSMRPLIHYGMLEMARKEIRRALKMLRPYYRRGVAVVGLEPSTIALFRDEATNLLPHDVDARRLAEESFLLSEFLQQEGVDLPRVNKRLLYHGHCHQKAVLDKQATPKLLRQMGAAITEPEIGCCGMAGSFGFEKDHYDVGVAVGERNLLPAVRDADGETVVIVEGFSCYEQIAQGTGRQPVHLAEFLAEALREAGVQRSTAAARDATKATAHANGRWF